MTHVEDHAVNNSVKNVRHNFKRREDSGRKYTANRGSIYSSQHKEKKKEELGKSCNA